MKKLSKLTAVITITLSVLVTNALAAVPAIIEDNCKPESGSGTAADPYVYLVNEDTKLTWKHLSENKEDGVTDLYEIREGDTLSGDLLYSWLFEVENITNPEGPYFLGINFYEGDDTESLPFNEDAFYFSFNTKREFPGKVKITMPIGDSFSDGDELYLYYYGGYDSTILHGSSPVTYSDEILDIDSGIEEASSAIVVEDGYVEFYVRHGGSYFLTKQAQEYTAEETNTQAEHYSSETIMGTIEALFPTEEIANAAASYYTKDTAEVVTQGDIDGINKLYLANMNLTDTSELESLYFARLNSLVLSDNSLIEIGSFSMPQLTYLDYSNNELESIGNVLNLSALENLILSGNNISSMPELSELSSLQTLDLSDNELVVFYGPGSDTLRYIDLSGNHLTSIRNISACTALEDINLLGQTYEASAEIPCGDIYNLEMAPSLIAGYGDSGTVSIINEKGETVYEGGFAQLEADDYTIDTAELQGRGQYTITVIGFTGDELLGTYTYNLTLEGDQMPIIVIGIIIGAVILLTAAIIIVRKRKRKV